MVAAIDEVGRGALAGPVTVGVVVVDADTPSAPAGVRDSKLLTPEARAKIAPRLRRWAPMYAVGHASAMEIDRIGIIAALRLAACRALGSLPVQPDCALLDGSHNWLTIPVPLPIRDDEPALFELDVVVEPFAFGPASGSGLAEVRAEIVPGTVVTQVKADMRCAAVAAASVLAKVERDAIMVELAERHPGYGWELNKGYSAPEHIAALRRLGPSDLHRLSWNLPGVSGEPDPAQFPGVIELDLGADALHGGPGTDADALRGSAGQPLIGGETGVEAGVDADAGVPLVGVEELDALTELGDDDLIDADDQDDADDELDAVDPDDAGGGFDALDQDDVGDGLGDENRDGADGGFEVQDRVEAEEFTGMLDLTDGRLPIR
jgi:ribonuclease HII